MLLLLPSILHSLIILNDNHLNRQYGLDEVKNIVEDGGQQLIESLLLCSCMAIFHDTRLLLFFVVYFYYRQYGLDEVKNIVEDGGQQLSKSVLLHSCMVILYDTRFLLFFVVYFYFCMGNPERDIITSNSHAHTRIDCWMLSTLPAVPSGIYSFWHGVIPMIIKWAWLVERYHGYLGDSTDSDCVQCL